jgi:hypothetical protein
MRQILGRTNPELTVKQSLKTLLLWIWQSPQCLIGAVLWCLLTLGHQNPLRHGEIWITPWLFGSGGVCLGEFVFVLKGDDEEAAQKHELGHRSQSRMLGPLYLIVVGFPSVCFNLLARRSRYFRKTYYQRFPENWADKLGKIQRKPSDFS